MALSTISGTTGITDATITSAKLADFSAAVDLNGVELILDANGNTSITADTDDRIDFKLGGVEHISINNSSGDTVIKPMVDAKDIVFQQYDGNKILEINDGNYVAISGAAAGPGELRFYEDTDLGSHYTGFKAGNATASVSYVLPLADGSADQVLATNGSGTLSWATASANTPSSADGQALGSASLEWSDLFLADSSTIQFGADQDTILTHTDGTGLTLNSTNKLCFNDTSQFIQGSSNAILSLGATDEIDLTATAIDINGTCDISGQFSLGGTNVTSSATELNLLDGVSGLVQADLTKLAAVDSTAAEINLIDGGTARGTDALASGDGILINDAGTMKMTNVDTVSTYFASHSVGGGNIVTTGALASGSIAAGFGAIDNGTSGIRTNTFTVETSVVPDAQDGAALGTSSLQFSDLFLADGAVISFGDDQDTTLTHTDGTGLTLNSTNKLCFNDASQFVQGSSNAILALGATDEIDLTATAIDINGTCDVSGTLTNGSAAVKVVGTETIWVPANAMTPTTSNGCAAIAAVETTSGRPDMYVLDFDKDADEFAQFAIAFPKSWNLGTITYQCFWSGLAATTGVAWSLQGVAMNDNETIDVAYGTAVVVDDDAQGAVEELLVAAESGAVTIAGTPADNDLCYFRIGRDISDGNDDMAGDARLHGIKIFFTTDAANDA